MTHAPRCGDLGVPPEAAAHDAPYPRPMAVDTGQSARSDRSTGPSERFDTVVVGGGQAGLAMGYHLAEAGRSFVILDASERTGDSWRSRWTSLRVFTPGRYSSLPGLPFPAPAWTYQT